MPKFTKGAKPGPGRPLGSKNQNFTNLSIWFEMLHDEVRTLDQAKRLDYIVMAIDKLLPKVPSLPATPGDSLDNALASQALLKALESDASEQESNPAGR